MKIRTFVYRRELRVVLGTPAKVSYSLANVDVDDDEIGARFDTLERDGWLHEAQIAGTVHAGGRGMSFVPTSNFRSRSSWMVMPTATRATRLKLGLRKFSSSYMFNLFGYRFAIDYDKTHPVFDKTREDISYSAFAVFARSVVGQETAFLRLIAGYRHRNSNIRFWMPIPFSVA